ncbi:MAG: hypothetical protein Q7R62_03440 [bacterium]|nr:hypothetical protein [bacterium]
MKIHKFADKKKELIAMIFIGLIVVSVSIYVVSLVNGLTEKVYRVFGRSAVSDSSFMHFDFIKFEELGLRPKMATTTPVMNPASTTVIAPATTTVSTTTPAVITPTTTPASSTR